jgi:hypothetical protein
MSNLQSFRQLWKSITFRVEHFLAKFKARGQGSLWRGLFQYLAAKFLKRTFLCADCKRVLFDSSYGLGYHSFRPETNAHWCCGCSLIIEGAAKFKKEIQNELLDVECHFNRLSARVNDKTVVLAALEGLSSPPFFFFFFFFSFPRSLLLLIMLVLNHRHRSSKSLESSPLATAIISYNEVAQNNGSGIRMDGKLRQA